ncbi:MAG: hypothetical protein ABW171_14935 [Steroidobacter sp.]
MSGLLYFTHAVDSHVYGAWYRIISSREIEVIGVGLLEPADYAGYSPESAAKSVLEKFVRQRIVDGAPIPSLDSLARSDEPDESDDNLHLATVNVVNAVSPPTR